jgi:hypothetical protein
MSKFLDALVWAERLLSADSNPADVRLSDELDVLHKEIVKRKRTEMKNLIRKTAGIMYVRAVDFSYVPLGTLVMMQEINAPISVQAMQEGGDGSNSTDDAEDLARRAIVHRQQRYGALYNDKWSTSNYRVESGDIGVVVAYARVYIPPSVAERWPGHQRSFVFPEVKLINKEMRACPIHPVDLVILDEDRKREYLQTHLLSSGYEF